MMTIDNILDDLEKKIDKAIDVIAMLKNRVSKLENDKKEIEAVLADREIRIHGLQKQLKELSDRPDDYEVEKYKANENLFKERIKTLLSKLDELKMLD